MRAPEDVAVSQAARCVNQHSDDRFRRLRWISPPPWISIENDEDGMSSQVHHPTGTREEWLAARDQLLVREKEHTSLGDELARLRRELPWVPVEKEYRFDTDEGEKTLSELLDRRSQLLVYHFMFGPSYVAGCPVNSSIADAVNGVLPHLHARDVTFLLVPQAPLVKLQPYHRRMGWGLPWVSTARTDFTSTSASRKRSNKPGQAVAQMGSAVPTIVERNARSTGTDAAGYLTEIPGFSSFVRDDGSVYHSYSTTWRGLEFLIGSLPDPRPRTERPRRGRGVATLDPPSR
jgi:predicted dithiol-disulfide oxidoreductase (DUF899 family)